MSISIAIIDSGVNPWHSHVGKIAKGIALDINSTGQVVFHNCFMDTIGHGTAIAGVIREKAPFAELCAVKIFYEELKAPNRLLIAALRWVIENNFKIVHLSLGTKCPDTKSLLEDLCQLAFEKKIIVVASARGPRDDIYPAVFETVIGVYWNDKCSEPLLIYHPRSRIEFGAYGWPRPLPGRPQHQNFCGSSFAAAHVTGLIARMLNKFPHADLLEVKRILADKSQILTMEEKKNYGS